MHFLSDVQSALAKFESALTPQMKKFIDRLPGVVTAKPAGAKRQAANTHQSSRPCSRPSFTSASSPCGMTRGRARRRRSTSSIPIAWRTCRAGCTVAYVPAYAELRPSPSSACGARPAAEVVQALARARVRPLQALARRLSRRAVEVQLHFHPQISAYVKERTWHASQRLKDRADGSVTMTMEVSDDFALRSWILSFGRLVRVARPRASRSGCSTSWMPRASSMASGEFSRIVDVDRAPLPFALPVVRCPVSPVVRLCGCPQSRRSLRTHSTFMYVSPRRCEAI